MNHVAAHVSLHMTADEFLAWPGDGVHKRFQLIDGEVRPVSPASAAHGAIHANLIGLLYLAIRNSGADLIIAAEGAIIPRLNASTNVRVPDIVVSASEPERNAQTVDDPILVIEILSPGNAHETRDNVRGYATLPGVREIAVVHSARMTVEVHRRTSAGEWAPDPDLVVRGERVRLESAGLDCPIEDIYARTWLARA